MNARSQALSHAPDHRPAHGLGEPAGRTAPDTPAGPEHARSARTRRLPAAALGAMGAPLAFVALPLYVHLPAHHAATYGLPLAALGAVLLATRLLDALIDPLMGQALDRLGTLSRLRVAAAGGAAALALGFAALFHPPGFTTGPGAGATHTALLAWCAAMLVVTYAGFSWTTLAHQAYSARLGGDLPQRSRIVAWREAWGLAGVIAASLLPALLGWTATAAALAGALALAWWMWPAGPAVAASRAASAAAPPAPPSTMPPLTPHAAPADPASPWVPLRDPALRRLLLVFVVNGLASAIPATLVLFFIRDGLGLPQWEPLFLASYFVAAAAALPLWVRAAARHGAGRMWGAGMLLTITAFGWTLLLDGGGTTAGWAFLAICIASGAALGADLALPGALLTGVIRRSPLPQADARYLGWWNVAAKLNLALAAGAALPLLQAVGYAPGTRSAAGLQALTWTYAGLPCLLKLLALALLQAVWMRHVPREIE